MVEGSGEAAIPLHQPTDGPSPRDARREELEQRLQFLLHDLAVGVARQGLGQEQDPHRGLEHREPRADPGLQLLLVRLGARGEVDDGRRLLAERPVRKPDQGGVGDRGMVVEDVLDLGGIDILAAADDDVLGAVAMKQKPSASSQARSPVRTQPSTKVSAVASGLFQ